MPVTTPLLDSIKYPSDLRKLEASQLKQVADELRAETIDAASVSVRDSAVDARFGNTSQAVAFLVSATANPPNGASVSVVFSPGQPARAAARRADSSAELIREV